jgi:hypothetical protein
LFPPVRETPGRAEALIVAVSHSGQARPLGRRELGRLRRAACAALAHPLGVDTDGAWTDCVEPDRPARTPDGLAAIGGLCASIGTVLTAVLLHHDPVDVLGIAGWTAAAALELVGILLLLGPVPFHPGPGIDTREWTSNGPVWPRRKAKL